MSSHRNFLIALTACLLTLSACGFEPVYGTRTHADQPVSAPELAAIAVEPVPGLIGQRFRADLEDRLNPAARPAEKQYSLTVVITPTSTPAAIERDGTVTRYTLHMNSSYTLTRLSDGAVVESGNVRRLASYNNLPNAYYSAYVSEQDAMKRVTTELAEEYRMRLAAFLARAS